jgi:prevent-host-death family protein
MVLSLIKDIRSVPDLKRNTKKVLARAREAGGRVIITINGHANAVLMNAQSFERYFSAVNLAMRVEAAKADIRAGRTRTLRFVLKEFRNAS